MKELTIDKKNGTVAYNDKYHIYWDTEDLTTYLSVTTLIGMFEQEFDTEFFLKYKAFERLCNPTKDFLANLRSSRVFDYETIKKLYPSLDANEFKNTIEEIRKEWKSINKQSCDMGTNIHAGYENMFFKTGKYQLSDYGFSISDIFVYKEGLHNIEYERQALPECLVSMKTKSGVRIAGQIDLLVANNNSINIFDYKGLDISTKILTDNGFKAMKDIAEGDMVYDIEGNKTKVIHKSELHERERIKIRFTSGEEIICDDEHRWLVTIDGKESVMNANDIYNSFRNGKCVLIRRAKYIKGNSIPTRSFKVNPYIYGVFLVLKDATHYDNYDYDNVLRIVNTILASNNLGICKNIRDIKNVIGKIINSQDCINDKYLLSCVTVRKAVVSGFLSITNIIPKSDGSITMSIKNKTFSLIAPIMSSIGIIFNSIKKNDKFYTVNISMRDNKVISKKYNIIYNIGDRMIESMEFIGKGYTQCIEVDSPTHTYLAGETLIPTHNTNKKLKFESYHDANGYVMMKEPLNHLMDCNMIHYTLQLSLYAYMVWRMHQDMDISMPKIIYARDKDNIKFHSVAYLRREIVDMLKYFRDYILGRKFEYSKVVYKDGKYYI